MPLSSRITLTPGVGYIYSRSTYRLRQHKSNELNSKYHPNWQGAIFTMNAYIKLYTKFFISLNLCYEQTRYKATANWNLIDKFMHPTSFKHTANGCGFINKLMFSYSLSPRISLMLSFDNLYRQTGYGIEYLYLKTGEIIRTRLNNATQKGQSILVGTNIYF